MCVFLCPHSRFVLRREAFLVRLLKKNRGCVPREAGFPFGQISTNALLPGERLLRPNRGLVPRQAIFSFGQIGTDASL
jgi:hypothetical protein